MPTFNSGEFLLEAVQSAVSQLGPDDELLIQDGRSTDGSIERIQALYASAPQVKVVSESDAGQSDALNRALARAVNPVVGWLNGDDNYYPGALDAARRGWLVDADADLVYGSWVLYDEQGSILRVCQPRQLTYQGLMGTSPQIYTGSMFMKASTVRRVGGIDQHLHFCMDMDLIARILACGRIPVQVPETLGGFRWYGGSKIGARLDFDVVREGLLVRRRHAHGVAQVARAYGASAAQALLHLSIPIRRSKVYARLRIRGSKAEVAKQLSQRAPRSG
jgi:hypothetical protein